MGIGVDCQSQPCPLCQITFAMKISGDRPALRTAAIQSNHGTNRRVALQQFAVLSTAAAAAMNGALCAPAHSSLPPPAVNIAIKSASPVSRNPWKPMSEYETGSSLDAFVMYLARFLIRYDEASATWYQQRSMEIPTSWDSAHRQAHQHHLVAIFGASIRPGLARYVGAKGAVKLWHGLTVYRNIPGAQAQLPLLFSLLAAPSQPSELIRAAIDAARAAGSTLPTDAKSAEDILLDPTALLPVSIIPVWDTELQGFVLPHGVAAAVERSLGPVSRSPITREVDMTSGIYFGFAASGGLGCALTHLAVVPLDVVKASNPLTSLALCAAK